MGVWSSDVILKLDTVVNRAVHELLPLHTFYLVGVSLHLGKIVSTWSLVFSLSQVEAIAMNESRFLPPSSN